MRDDLTALAYVLDCSGSMSILSRDTIGSFNAFIKEQKAQSGDAIFSLATFADHYSLIHDGIPLKEVPELTETSYRCQGSTALLDAVGMMVSSLGKRLDSMKEEAKPSRVICVIHTDGEENASRHYQHHAVREMVNHQRDKYSWEFVFIGASNIDAFKVANSIGVPQTHTYSYTPTSVGTQVYFQNASAGVSDFRRSKIGTSFNMSDPNASIQGIQAQSTPVVVGTALPANGVVIPSPAQTTVSTSTPDTTDNK
jgi:hypothetical protein